MPPRAVARRVRSSRATHPKTHALALALAQHTIGGGFPEGTFLPPESDLGRRYGMSRPSVREAIRRLEAAGLVQIRRSVGTYVNPPQRWNLFDLLVLRAFISSGNLPAIVNELIELRRAVEVEASGLAAGRITADRLQELRQWLDHMDAQMGDSDVFAQADIAYHNGIAAASGNRFLQGVMRFLSEPLTEARRLTSRAGGREGRANAQRHHTAIFDAIAARDGTAAREAMTRHLVEVEDDIRRAILALVPSNRREQHAHR